MTEVQRENFVEWLIEHSFDDNIEPKVFDFVVGVSAERKCTLEKLYNYVRFEIMGFLVKGLFTLDDINSGVISWDSFAFKKNKECEQAEESRYFKHKKVEEGEFACKKCKSKQCYFYQSQTRSADEPMTTTVVCTKCHGSYSFC